MFINTHTHTHLYKRIMLYASLCVLLYRTQYELRRRRARRFILALPRQYPVGPLRMYVRNTPAAAVLRAVVRIINRNERKKIVQ